MEVIKSIYKGRKKEFILMQSKLYSLITNDVLRGFFVAIIGAVLSLLYEMLKGSVSIDLKQLGIVGLTAGIAYLIKTFFSDENGKLGGVI